MSESSRQLVRRGLDQAFDFAEPVLQARMAQLTPEARVLANQCAEGIKACLKDQAETPSPSPAIQEALVRLTFSHGDPKLVAALKDYLDMINVHLMEARDHLRPSGERKDS